MGSVVWLIETRPRKYATFLKTMASPEVAGRLTPQSRVSIFKDAFGDNLRMLDVEMLRYYQRLKVAADSRRAFVRGHSA